MIVIAHFLSAVAELLSFALQIFTFLIIARAVLSWVNPDPNNGIVRFIHSSTDPLLDKVRSKIPPMGMFDVSALLVLAVLLFLNTFLVGSLADYAKIARQAALSSNRSSVVAQ
jgi:YggT family protein